MAKLAIISLIAMAIVFVSAALPGVEKNSDFNAPPGLKDNSVYGAPTNIENNNERVVRSANPEPQRYGGGHHGGNRGGGYHHRPHKHVPINKPGHGGHHG